MVRRSLLFSPGDRPEMMRKALTTNADVLVFDLEDAVSVQRKVEARNAIRSILDENPETTGEICVRINRAGLAGDDLTAILDGHSPDSVMVPKVGTPDEIETVDRLVGEHGVDLPILAIIESADGVLAAHNIARVEPTDALVFGAEDLAADIGAVRTASGTEVTYARQRVVVAASASNVDAIDTVYTDYSDTEGLLEDTNTAIQFGYDGKLAIHPAQVDPINEAFTPDPEKIAWAKRVLSAQQTARTEGRGVFSVDGTMIDAPLIAQAERILERATADHPSNDE